MTRRASALDSIEPEPVASVHPLDLERFGVAAGGIVTIESRRGRISLYARADDGMARGSIFIPFCRYYEAAANMLTNPVAGPVRKDPRVQVLRREAIRRRAASSMRLSWGAVPCFRSGALSRLGRRTLTNGPIGDHQAE